MDTLTPPAIPAAPAPEPRRPDGNEKLWAIASHLAVFIGAPLLVPLIVYLVMRDDSAFVRHHAREALNFHLSLFIYALCCVPLTMILIGVPLLIALGLFSYVIAIIAAIKCSDGAAYRYPLCIRLVT